MSCWTFWDAGGMSDGRTCADLAADSHVPRHVHSVHRSIFSILTPSRRCLRHLLTFLPPGRRPRKARGRARRMLPLAVSTPPRVSVTSSWSSTHVDKNDRRWWRLVAVMAVAASIGIAALAIRSLRMGETGRPPPPVARLSTFSAQSKLETLIKRYPTDGEPCSLPAPDEIAGWHGVRLQAPADARAGPDLPASLAYELAAMGIKVVLTRPPRDGGSWVVLVPEYHGRAETEELLSAIAARLTRALRAPTLRLFVEAWSKSLELPKKPGGKETFSGIEDMEIYPVSRAAWGLLDLISAGLDPRAPDFRDLARHAVVAKSRGTMPMVGDHPSERDAVRAVERYAAAWNAIVGGFGGSAVAIEMPVGADYYQPGRWVQIARTVRLSMPVEPDAYAQGGRLSLLAGSMAAITSRIRTAEYAFHVLETLSAKGERIGMLQVGANHMCPLIGLLERAGAGVAVLFTPLSQQWLGAVEPWRCPAEDLPEPLRGALGYFRLPGDPSDRREIRLWTLLAEGER